MKIKSKVETVQKGLGILTICLILSLWLADYIKSAELKQFGFWGSLTSLLALAAAPLVLEEDND